MNTPRLLAAAALALCALPAPAQTGFVNWESPHVSPLALGQDGKTLLAVNTPDDRLEVLRITRDGLVPSFSIPVGVNPVSVRPRSATEVWVVNHVSDSISVVDLRSRNVVATIDTDDEPCDVVFAYGKAYVSCSQTNTVMILDPADLAATPARLAIEGEDPRALAVSPDGRSVYVAIFESGNGTTVLGGGIDPALAGTLAFPPNVVDRPGSPWSGQNPPPNSGGAFSPPINPVLPTPPGVSLIVRVDDSGLWWDDNGGDWTEFVSGAKANKSGRPLGWALSDHDIAVIATRTDQVRYVDRLMNVCMALAVNPATGDVSLVGTEATNEVRFEPNITGTFTRVEIARVGFAPPPASLPPLGIDDLNPHLDYSVGTVSQPLRDQSIGDPRGIVWNEAGTRGYVSGMGSNNVVVIDASGQRAGLAPTIEVGEGPTGLALDEAHERLFVLNKFEGSISVISTVSETEVGRVSFFDPEPAAIKSGRVHLYGTHENSGLGQIACASCHVDARLDRLAWDLGDPSGDLKSLAGQNKGAGIPGLNTGFAKHHPMKGPMTTQTLQDIIGKEPLHWRGDRDGLEEFNGAFIGLQGDDTDLTPQAMQEFEDFLATIHFPPNPFRNIDNTLPTSLALDGHFSTGRFTPAGTPLPVGDAQRGLGLYRPPNTLDDPFACVSCHTLPTGLGTDMKANGLTFQSIAPGPNGERHHALVSVDGSKQKTIKIPHLRNLYDKVGFDLTQPVNRAGFGLLHDGSVDSIARFVEEPAFALTDEQDTADLVAFLLAFSGSDLPQGKKAVLQLEPPGTASKDAHAAVGTQVTVDDPTPDPTSQALVTTLLGLAQTDDVGLIAKGVVAGERRGFTYVSAQGLFQSDRAAETWTPAQLAAAPAQNAQLTYTAVPFGTEMRAGVDRDADGWYDMDEIEAGSDPADPASTPGPSPVSAPTPPTSLAAAPASASSIRLTWLDQSANETGFRIERASAGSGSFDLVALLPPGSEGWADRGLPSGFYDYRVRSFNAVGSRGFAAAVGARTVGASAAIGPQAAASSSLGPVQPRPRVRGH